MVIKQPFSEDLSPSIHVPQPGYLESPSLLPVCCICGLIRDDRSSTADRTRWIRLKTYRQIYHLSVNEELFTHTYCPDCFIQVQDQVRRYFSEQRAP